MSPSQILRNRPNWFANLAWPVLTDLVANSWNRPSWIGKLAWPVCAYFGRQHKVLCWNQVALHPPRCISPKSSVSCAMPRGCIMERLLTCVSRQHCHDEPASFPLCRCATRMRPRCPLAYAVALASLGVTHPRPRISYILEAPVTPHASGTRSQPSRKAAFAKAWPYT
jgi:hypothetical protein